MSPGIPSPNAFRRVMRSVCSSDTAALGIENWLHWAFDVSFREDDWRIRQDAAAQTTSVLRHIALDLIRREESQARHEGQTQTNWWGQRYLSQVLESVPKVGDIPKAGRIFTDCRVFDAKKRPRNGGCLPDASKIIEIVGLMEQTLTQFLCFRRQDLSGSTGLFEGVFADSRRSLAKGSVCWSPR